MTPSYYSPYKAAHHIETLQDIRNGRPTPPTNIQIDLEAYCPHSCEFCSYRNVGWQEHGMVFVEPKRPSTSTSIPWEIAQHIPHQMEQAGIPSIEITGGGESLAYPHIEAFLDELEMHGITTAIVTNGVLFKPELQTHLPRALEWLRFSMDAITPDTYHLVHRTPAPVFNSVLKNIDHFMQQKGETTVGASFVITPHNRHEVPHAAEFYRDRGFDNIRFTFTYEPTGTGRLEEWERAETLDAIQASKLKFDSGSFHVFGVNRIHDYSAPNDDFSVCGYQHFVWAIGFDGNVYPCCIMKYHPEFVMGSLHENSLDEIVSSPLRARFATLDPHDCKSCWLRDKNKFIESLIVPPAHADFV